MDFLQVNKSSQNGRFCRTIPNVRRTSADVIKDLGKAAQPKFRNRKMAINRDDYHRMHPRE